MFGIGPYAWFTSFKKPAKGGISKGRTIGVISMSSGQQFQNPRAPYARQPKCSNFYNGHLEMKYILSITVNINLEHGTCAKRCAANCTTKLYKWVTFRV